MTRLHKSVGVPQVQAPRNLTKTFTEVVRNAQTVLAWSGPERLWTSSLEARSVRVSGLTRRLPTLALRTVDEDIMPVRARLVNMLDSRSCENATGDDMLGACVRRRARMGGSARGGTLREGGSGSRSRLDDLLDWNFLDRLRDGLVLLRGSSGDDLGEGECEVEAFGFRLWGNGDLCHTLVEVLVLLVRMRSARVRERTERDTDLGDLGLAMDPSLGVNGAAEVQLDYALANLGLGLSTT